MGGGGESTTTSRAEFPPEFRPLATSAVGQIQALQDLLPLSQFAASRATPTAGISPFQQAAMNLLPQVLAPTAGLQSLGTLGPSFAGAAQNALRAGQPTAGAQFALNQLAPGLAALGTTPAVPSPTGFTPQPLGDVTQLQQQLQQPIPGATPALAPITPPIPPGTELTGPVSPTSPLGALLASIQQSIAGLPQSIAGLFPPPTSQF